MTDIQLQTRKPAVQKSECARRRLATNRTSPRDDSGKVRRTMLRDERASWLKEGRIFRIMPSRPQAQAG